MIDLRKKSLPNCIECNGRLFSIKTDFREWLEFGELIKSKDLKAKQILYLFKNEIPSENPFQALLDFYVNPNITPRKQENDDGRIVLDYIEDGEYLVGSFWNAYGIDLTTIEELHWHTFQALLGRYQRIPKLCRSYQGEHIKRQISQWILNYKKQKKYGVFRQIKL